MTNIIQQIKLLKEADEMKPGQQYLVTNIKFTKVGHNPIVAGNNTVDDFELPKTVNEIHEWLADFDIECHDKTALAIYVRSRLFYYYELNFDYYPINLLENALDFLIDQPCFPDIADHEYAEMTTARVDINIPKAHIATLLNADVEFANGNVEQALYESMLRQLQVDIDVPTISDLILNTMRECMDELNAGSPDTIAEVVFESFPSSMLTDQKQNEIYDAVHNLASVLVKDIGKYL